MILAAVAAFVVCTNCCGVGSVEVTCDKCDGKGFYLSTARRSGNGQNRGVVPSSVMPCKGCSRGLLKLGQKGSGKVLKTCPTCKGRKRIKSPIDSIKEK